MSDKPKATDERAADERPEPLVASDSMVETFRQMREGVLWSAVSSIVDLRGVCFLEQMAEPGDEWRRVGLDMAAAMDTVKELHPELAAAEDDELCLEGATN